MSSTIFVNEKQLKLFNFLLHILALGTLVAFMVNPIQNFSVFFHHCHTIYLRRLSKLRLPPYNVSIMPKVPTFISSPKMFLHGSELTILCDFCPKGCAYQYFHLGQAHLI